MSRVSTPGASRFLELLVFACILGFGVASIAGQSPGGVAGLGLGPEVLIGGWLAVFAALAVLYAQDRRSRAAVAPGERVAPAPKPAAAPNERKATPARQSEPPAVETPSCLERSISLLADGRFVEASRAAHDGLANGDDPGPLLIALSRAELARGQVDRAISSARDALSLSRSPASVANLIRILTRTRRFAPEDGPMLRRAVARHPNRVMLRHALGVFEAMHGEPGAARDHLQAALRLETDPKRRRAIERDLVRTQGVRTASAHSAPSPSSPGR